jgi:hypothetical protein
MMPLLSTQRRKRELCVMLRGSSVGTRGEGKRCSQQASTAVVNNLTAKHDIKSQHTVRALPACLRLAAIHSAAMKTQGTTTRTTVQMTRWEMGPAGANSQTSRQAAVRQAGDACRRGDLD